MSNALKDLFQEQADAIREGLGNIGGIAPNETPALIREIVSMIGTGGGGGGGTGRGLKFATGTFDTGTTGIYRQTITHGLGVMPDFVMVYVDVMLVPTTSAEVIEKYPLQCVWGLHSKFASKAGVAGYYNIIGIAPDNTSGFLDVKKTDLQIYCPDDATFEFGLSSGTKGLLYEDMTYSWVAISGMATGGGSSADVRYVTFRNEATGEEFVKPVAVGDDCVDVVAKGLWATPTKGSDAQYHYTYYGWGAEDGGAADANILKNITEDKTVYAVFSKTLRYYTITYYDEDGTTVLNTETLAYGAVPSYTPTKEGFVHAGWAPSLVEVTGDATYTAVWSEKITFANGLWSDIARISESGQAAEYFAIGDKKAITFKDPSGTGWTVNVEIIAFDHDNLADGSGKAGITVITEIATYKDAHSANQYASSVWNYSDIRDNLHDVVLPSFPAELQNAIKTVTKEYGYFTTATDYSTLTIGTIADRIWIPSVGELGLVSTSADLYAYGDGTKYDNYTKIKKDSSGKAVSYPLRSRAAGSNYTRQAVACRSVGDATATNTTSKEAVVFGFCI